MIKPKNKLNMPIDFERIVSLDDLLRRWPNASENRIIELCKSRKENGDLVLRAGFLQQSFKKATGEHVYRCQGSVRAKEIPGQGWCFVRSEQDIVFDERAIEEVENNFDPEVAWKPINASEHSLVMGDWIGCDTLAGRWGCSPFDVVNTIEEKGLNIDAHYEKTWFRHDTLGDFSVHSVDLAKFEHEHAAYLESLKPPLHTTFEAPTAACTTPRLTGAEDKHLSDEIEWLKTELAEVRAENDRLQAISMQESEGPCPECEKLRIEITDLKREVEKQTALASASRWNASCEAICKTLPEVILGEQIIFNTDFINKLGNHYSGSGVVLSDAERLAWKHLPQHLKNRRGNKKRKI